MGVSQELEKIQTAIDSLRVLANAQAGGASSGAVAAASAAQAAADAELVVAAAKQTVAGLDVREAAVKDVAARYAAAIGDVTKAVAKDGAVGSVAFDATKTALMAKLALKKDADLQKRIAEVGTYDGVTAALLAGKAAAVEAAKAALDGQKKAVDEKKGELDSVETAINALSSKAREAAVKTQGLLAAAKTEADGARPARGVVAYADAKAQADALVAKADPAQSKFDADVDADPAKELTTAWSTARAAYESALTTYLAKVPDVAKARLDAIDAQAKADLRVAVRTDALEKAIKDVV